MLIQPKAQLKNSILEATLSPAHLNFDRALYSCMPSLLLYALDYANWSTFAIRLLIQIEWYTHVS